MQVAKYQSQAQKGQQVLTSLVRSESHLSSAPSSKSTGMTIGVSSTRSVSGSSDGIGIRSSDGSNGRGSGALVLALTNEPSSAITTGSNAFYSNPAASTPAYIGRKSGSSWERQATRAQHHKPPLNAEDIAEFFSAWGRRYLKRRQLITGAGDNKQLGLYNASTMAIDSLQSRLHEKASVGQITSMPASAAVAQSLFVAATPSKGPASNSTRSRRRHLTVSACPKSLPLCQETRRQQRQREIMQQRLEAIAAAKAEAKKQEMRAAQAAARAEEQAKARAAAAPAREAERARAVKLREQRAADAAAAVEIEKMDAATRNRHVLSAFLREKRSAQKLRAAVGQRGGGAKRRRRPLPDADLVLKQANEVSASSCSREFLCIHLSMFLR